MWWQWWRTSQKSQAEKYLILSFVSCVWFLKSSCPLLILRASKMTFDGVFDWENKSMLSNTHGHCVCTMLTLSHICSELRSRCVIWDQPHSELQAMLPFVRQKKTESGNPDRSDKVNSNWWQSDQKFCNEKIVCRFFAQSPLDTITVFLHCGLCFS